MTDNEAVTEAEKILQDASKQEAANILQRHAEMILVTALNHRTRITSELMVKASRQGIDYVTGLMLAVGLTARHWGALLADQPGIDFNLYEKREEGCEEASAHDLTHDVLAIKTVADANSVREALTKRWQEDGSTAFTFTCMHMIGIFGGLVTAVMDIRNGDYKPDGEGDS